VPQDIIHLVVKDFMQISGATLNILSSETHDDTYFTSAPKLHAASSKETQVIKSH
jgi:hypothetical protein